MNFTEDELQEFIRMWQAEFQETMSLDFARQRAEELVELYTALADSNGAHAKQQSNRSDEILPLLPEIN
jgi:hypothetical protein